MKPIGGYFGLEVPEGRLPYPNAVPVNFGRGGLELIIRSRGYRKVWIPDYICPVVPEYLSKIGIEYAIYEIGLNLEPIDSPLLGQNEAFLYVNYFGIKDDYCRCLESRCKNLILDLTQAFYYEPMMADGFNSARKFFGVPDGGFAFGQGLNDDNLPESSSCERCNALLHRAEGDVAGGYAAFQRLDDALKDFSVAKMSPLTRKLLSLSDRTAAAKRRRENFSHLHKALDSTNELKIVASDLLVPLVYPYCARGGCELKKKLISKNIFCPTYWPSIENLGSVDANFVSDIVNIPIDQRYTVEDMNHILKIINS